MKQLCYGVGFSLLLLVGCAPTAQQQADYAEARQMAVAPATYDKLVKGLPLTLTDIKELAAKKVSAGVVVRHLQSTKTVYRLSTLQVDDLRKNQVPDAVVDALLASNQYLEEELRRREIQPYSIYDDPFYSDPYYRRGYYRDHPYYR